jgi:hypothetical protein
LRADSVAKLQKWLAPIFPQKEQPSDNRRSMCPQACYREHYTGGTSAAAALTSRLAHRIHDALEDVYREAFLDLPHHQRAVLMISAGELREADRARCVHRPLARAAVGTHKRALAELS